MHYAIIQRSTEWILFFVANILFHFCCIFSFRDGWIVFVPGFDDEINSVGDFEHPPGNIC